MNTLGTTPSESMDNAVERTEEKPLENAVDNMMETQEKAVESVIKEEEIQELGGPKGPEPTRFGDWERNGRCSDF